MNYINTHSHPGKQHRELLWWLDSVFNVLDAMKPLIWSSLCNRPLSYNLKGSYL